MAYRIENTLQSCIERSGLGELANPNCELYQLPLNVDGWKDEELLALLEKMLVIRYSEEAIASWVVQGKAKCPCHLGIGQEAVAVGIAHHLRRSDKLFGNHRSHAHYLAVGGDPYKLLAEVLGRKDGCSRGMGGSMHLYAEEHGFVGSVPIVAGTIPLAVGAGLAAKMDGGESLAVAYFGDGACEEGVVHECLNLASIYQIPVLFVVENNLFSSHLDISLRQPNDSVARFAAAHKVKNEVVDGNDVIMVADTVGRLIDNIRTERCPGFVEAVTYRWRGHVGAKEDIDVGVHRKIEDLNAWKKRDPVERLVQALIKRDSNFYGTYQEIKLRVRETIERFGERALQAEWPIDSDLINFVYAGVAND